MRWIVLGVLVLAVAGCTGQTKTYGYQDQAALQRDLEDGVEGIVVYPPAWHRELYATSIRVEEGQIVGRADGEGVPTCQPVESSVLALHPDLSRPMRIDYEPGELEANTFGVNLERGMLTGVNTQSNPDRGSTLAGLATAAAAVITAVAAFDAAPDKPPACNQGKVLIAVDRCDTPDCRGPGGPEQTE